MASRSLGVHGPEDLDQTQTAEIISHRIGRPVRHVAVTVDEAKQGMLDTGMSKFVIDLLGEMYAGLLEGRRIARNRALLSPQRKPRY